VDRTVSPPCDHRNGPRLFGVRDRQKMNDGDSE
jgi:hypothetical protein